VSVLHEIVKAHIRAARRYQEICELERLAGSAAATYRARGELVSACQFYDEVQRILAGLECES
jgi:hypothetical protein